MDPTSGPLLVAAAVSVAAGSLSFASPCVLPLVPGYLAFVSGLTGAQLDDGGNKARGTVLAGSGLFVLGFAVFFTLIGLIYYLRPTPRLFVASSSLKENGELKKASSLVSLAKDSILEQKN